MKSLEAIAVAAARQQGDDDDEITPLVTRKAG
jgi:hypothetical protein